MLLILDFRCTVITLLVISLSVLTLHPTAVINRNEQTCVQVEQLTLSPELKAMMLYFLLVFLWDRNKYANKKSLTLPAHYYWRSQE